MAKLWVEGEPLDILRWRFLYAGETWRVRVLTYGKRYSNRAFRLEQLALGAGLFGRDIWVECGLIEPSPYEIDCLDTVVDGIKLAVKCAVDKATDNALKLYDIDRKTANPIMINN